MSESVRALYMPVRWKWKNSSPSPFTYRDRPKWDLDYWKIYRKKKVYCREMLNPEIYSQMEQLQYAQTPEFLVVVEK